MNNMQKHLQVSMPDGSKWAVPVLAIAENHARYYAKEYGGDHDACMKLHTAPLFDSDYSEIEDWAANNMNWEDVKGRAVLVSAADDEQHQEGWVNGEKSLITLP